MKHKWILFIILLTLTAINSTYPMLWEMQLRMDYTATVRVYLNSNLYTPIHTISSNVFQFNLDGQSGLPNLQPNTWYAFRVTSGAYDRYFTLNTGYSDATHNADFKIYYNSSRIAVREEADVYTRVITLGSTQIWVPPLSVNISGPNSLRFKTNGTYTANASGGAGGYIYYWETDRVTKPNYVYIGNNISTTVGMGYEDFHVRVTVTSGSQSQTVTKTIYYDDGLPKIVYDKEGLMRIPTSLRLYENYPNPFNPSTMVKYDLPEAGAVQIKVYDILGTEVAELVNEIKPAGYHEVEFNAGNLTSGIYFYRIQSGDFVDTKKMILMK